MGSSLESFSVLPLISPLHKTQYQGTEKAKRQQHILVSLTILPKPSNNRIVDHVNFIEKDAYHLESYHWTNIQKFHSKWDIKDQKLEYLVAYNQVYKENYNSKDTGTRCLSGSVWQLPWDCSTIPEWLSRALNEKLSSELPWAPSVICFVPPWYQVQQSHRYCTIRSTTAQKCTHNSTHHYNAKASNSNLLQQSKSHSLKEKTQSTRWVVLLRTPEDRNTALLIKITCMLE